MSSDIIIMTTAIDRPELHAKVLESYKQYISNVNVQWIITINNVLNNVTETEANFRNILSDYNLHIKTYETGGTKKDWFNSVKYCIDTAHTLNTNIGYLFLEDDWLCNVSDTLNNDMRLVTDTNSHISLASRDAVSFNPGIWGKEAFEKLMHFPINNLDLGLGARFNDGENTNAERICCPHPESTNFINNFKSVNRFRDIGREWQYKTIKTRTFNIK